MNTTPEALKELYVKLGGESAAAADLTTSVEVMNAISVLLGGEGGAVLNPEAIMNIAAVATAGGESDFVTTEVNIIRKKGDWTYENPVTMIVCQKKLGRAVWTPYMFNGTADPASITTYRDVIITRGYFQMFFIRNNADTQKVILGETTGGQGSTYVINSLIDCANIEGTVTSFELKTS